jgi:aminomethyltransferase
MPVNYPDGIIEEHKATRGAVGVFDVCHMGEIHFRGPRAAEAVQRLVTNNVGAMTDGRAMYAVACHPSGGIVDDLIVYRVASDHFLIVVNASNIDKDSPHFVENAGALCQIDNESDSTALIAFQGPKAEAALAGLTDADLASLRSFCFLPNRQVAGRPAWIARTGYTGEDGFEIFCSPDDALAVWDALVDAAAGWRQARGSGRARHLAPGGASQPLRQRSFRHHHAARSRAWLGGQVRRGDFIGKEALLRQREAGLARKLVGFEMRERGIARHGYAISDVRAAHAWAKSPRARSAQPIGKNIGMGYVPVSHAEPGTRIVIDCRGKPAQAEVVKGPFYRRQGA